MDLTESSHTSGTICTPPDILGRPERAGGDEVFACIELRFCFSRSSCRSRRRCVSAQDRTADQGVYTSAQAARGAAVFDAHCVFCHREGGTAPVLAGERFTKSFADSTLLAVFTTIQTTMPREAPGSLTEKEYVDVVAHLLEAEWLSGRHDRAGSGRSRGHQGSGQGRRLEFRLVHVVGCLSQAGRVWTLAQATDPVRTRAPEAADDAEAAQLDACAARSPVVQAPAGLRRTGWVDRPESGCKRLPHAFRRRGASERHLDENPHGPLPGLRYNFCPNP